MDTITIMPKPLIKYIKKLPEVYGSPLSSSYYSKPLINTSFRIGCIRISDHWNYTKRDRICCKTDRAVANGAWAIAVWTGDIWEVKRTYCNSKLKTLWNYELRSIIL